MIVMWCDVAPGARGEGDEGMRRQPLFVCGVKACRIKLLQGEITGQTWKTRTKQQENEELLHVGLSKRRGCGACHKY